MATEPRVLNCPHCRLEMETTGAFCTECGAKLQLVTSVVEPGALAPISLATAAGPAPSTTLPTSPSDPPAKDPPSPVIERTSAALLSPAVAPLPEPFPAKAGTPSLPELTPAQWMQVLTAVGHYAGVLRGLRLEAESQSLLSIHQSLLRYVSALDSEAD